MRKHGGAPSRREKYVTLAAISPPGVARGRFVGGHQSGLAGCKSPLLFRRGASSCSAQQQREREPWGVSPQPSAPTYLPTQPKHGSSMDLGRLRARLAAPLTEVKSTESGKVDVLNIEVTGKVVKMLCAPYKDPQDPLKFLEALDTDVIILNANLADGADPVSPPMMAKLIDNPETVLVIYGEVETVWDALQTFMETPGSAENDYWYEKVPVCCWPPGAGET